MMLRIILSILAFCLISICSAADTPPTAVYHLWAGSNSPARLGYELPLIRLLLDETVAQYGPYELHVYQLEHSYLESYERIDKGKFDFVIAPDDKGTIPENTKIRRIPHKIWNGYLGYRQIVVRKHRLAEFEGVESLASLRQFKIGQGENWRDNQFYARNGVKLVEAKTFSALFSMLKHNRFDCVPLGINEVDATVQEQNSQGGDFVIVPNLILRYPLEAYLMVSAYKPQLAKRLSAGFEIVKANGKRKVLLENFMQDKLKKLDHPGVVILDLN